MKTKLGILRLWVLAGFFLMLLPLAAQEIEVNAPDEVLDSETFQIQYQIYSRNPIQKMPSLLDAKDYEQLREPQVQQSRPSPFWGRNYYTLSLVYTLKAKKTGKLRLPRIEVLLENRKLTSEEGVIHVLKTPKMEDIDCFVKTTTTRQTITIGDTLLLEYKLYSSKEISRVLDMEITRSRSFDYHNITPSISAYTEEKIDGKIYKVYTIGRYILEGKSIGLINFPESEVHIEYTYPTGRMKKDAWGRVYKEQLREVRTCLVDPFTLRVHNMIMI